MGPSGANSATISLTKVSCERRSFPVADLGPVLSWRWGDLLRVVFRKWHEFGPDWIEARLSAESRRYPCK